MTEPARIAVLGAGSWGTALAIALTRNGRQAVLWGNEPGPVEAMCRDRVNAEFLPDHPLPPGLEITGDLEAALAGASDLLLVVPSHAFREVLERIAPAFRDGMRLAWATKGFASGRGRLLDGEARAVLGDEVPLAVLSGPTFAGEIAAGLPAAATVAASDPAFAESLAGAFRDARLRIYTTDDLTGVQVGGAVKNVLAVAAGIADGLGFGANTRAALITRGLAELMRLGVAMGGRQETFMGLAGLGDLVLTCTDDQSRNRRFGLALGRGEAVEAAERAVGQVVEGVRTAREVMRLARELGTDMPITEQVEAVLYHGVPPRDAVTALLARDPAPEFR